MIQSIQSFNMSANTVSERGQIAIPIKNKELLDTRGLIAGSWKHASDNKTFPVYEPSSGNVLRECSSFGQNDFIEAIDVADKGYRKFWASTTARERGELLRAWYEEILHNIDDCRSFPLHRDHVPCR